MTALEKEYVTALFSILTPESVVDITTQSGVDDDWTWIRIHFIAPDEDGTHYSLNVNLKEPTWSIYDHDADEHVYWML